MSTLARVAPDVIDVLLRTIIDRTDPTRHRLGLGDHDAGSRRLRCGACSSDAYLTLCEILAEEVRAGRSGVVAELDPDGLTTTRIRSRAIDAVRRDRVARGLPARSRQAAATAVVTRALAAAEGRGELALGQAGAGELLFRVIEFLTTADDRAEPGHRLPWSRLGRGLGPGGSDLTGDASAAAWTQVESALATTAAGARFLARTVGRYSEHLAAPARDADLDAGNPVVDADPHLSWFDGVELAATAAVGRGEGTADAVLARLIDREMGGGIARLSDQVRAADPQAWRQVTDRIARAAGQG